MCLGDFELFLKNLLKLTLLYYYIKFPVIFYEKLYSDVEKIIYFKSSVRHFNSDVLSLFRVLNF